jgi:hypothetical protein
VSDQVDGFRSMRSPTSPSASSAAYHGQPLPTVNEGTHFSLTRAKLINSHRYRLVLTHHVPLKAT